MLSTTFTLLATLAATATAVVVHVPGGNIAVADAVQNIDPEIYATFQTTPVYSIEKVATKPRQAVPIDATPDPNRPVVTPENIFVLQCDLPGFHPISKKFSGCLVYGAPPGDCVNYSSFNSSQAFLDEYENKTSSLSVNTGGLCQFFKFRDCNNKGDDRGVTLSYNYNLNETTDDYGGDYDNQISSWRC